MRCSRVALSLLLAVLGGAVLALTPTDGRRGVAADIGSTPPANLNSAKEVDNYQGAYDWGDDEYGYVYSRPEGQFGNNREESDSTAANEDSYTNDKSEARQYDFEDEYGSEDYQDTADSQSDQNDCIYNDYDYEGDYDYTNDDYDYDTSVATDYEYDADEAMYGRESYGYPKDAYTADHDFGYSPAAEDEADNEADDGADDEMHAEAYDEMHNGMYDEVDDEMEDEMGDGMGDQADDETADEADDYSYEYAYPESRYGYSKGGYSRDMDEYFEEEISSNRGNEDTTSADYSSDDYSSDDYSYYDEFGYEDGDWGETVEETVEETVDEAEGTWTKGNVDATGADADTASTDTNPTDTNFGQYECWNSKPGEVSEGSSEEESADYEYADPEDFYGDRYIEPITAATRKQGLELFNSGPAELLLATDREMLMSLERLCEEPSGTRRAALNEHIECIGMEAIDFATRFEDTTGSEVLGLADDLPGCAALLATFRLLERGELNVEEAVDLLRRSLTGLSQEWIEGVSDITADAFEDSGENGPPTASLQGPLFGTVISLAAQSLDDLGGAICSLSRRLDKLKGRF